MSASSEAIDGKQHTHHTFHLPNGYPRSTVESNNDYHAVPADEVDGVGGGAHNIDDDDNDDDTLAEIGVETTPAWHSMTATQHALVRLAFGILGATVLLPFNALITPSEYYRSLLAGTARESSFMSWFIAVYNVSCIGFGAHATTSMPRASVGRRILHSESVILAVLLLTTILVSTLGKTTLKPPPSTSAFPLMIGLTLVLAAATSYLQIAVVTLANAYGPSCMGTMLSGQGFVGATISLVQLIAAFSSSSSQPKNWTGLQEQARTHRAAIEFFATTTILMGFGMAVFIALQRSEVYIDMRRKMDSEKSGRTNTHEEETAPENVVSAEQQEHPSSVTGIKRYMGVEMQRQTSLVVSTQKKVLLPSLSIAYIFVITLALFPALTARIQSTGKTISPIVFVALHFFIFNLGDLLGRSAPSIVPRVFLLRKVKIIALLCLLRTAFVPLLGYCNISSSSPTVIDKVLFGDIGFYLLIAVLGISNGLLATSIFVTGPHQESLVLPSEQALAAGLLTWWLSIGLAIGSLLSFVVAP